MLFQLNNDTLKLRESTDRAGGLRGGRCGGSVVVPALCAVPDRDVQAARHERGDVSAHGEPGLRPVGRRGQGAAVAPECAGALAGVQRGLVAGRSVLHHAAQLLCVDVVALLVQEDAAPLVVVLDHVRHLSVSRLRGDARVGSGGREAKQGNVASTV